MHPASRSCRSPPTVMRPPARAAPRALPCRCGPGLLRARRPGRSPSAGVSQPGGVPHRPHLTLSRRFPRHHPRQQHRHAAVRRANQPLSRPPRPGPGHGVGESQRTGTLVPLLGKRSAPTTARGYSRRWLDGHGDTRASGCEVMLGAGASRRRLQKVDSGGASCPHRRSARSRCSRLGHAVR